MSKNEGSALVALIIKVVDSRLKKILPGLIEKYINESVNADISEEVIRQISNSAKKQIVGGKTQKARPKSNTSFKQMMSDDDEIVTEQSDPRVIEAAKREKKQKIDQKVYVKNNPTLDKLLKATAKEIIDDPTKRIAQDNGVAGVVAGANVLEHMNKVGNNDLKQIIKASGADDRTAALLSRDYSKAIKPFINKKQNNAPKRTIQPIVEDSNYNYADPNYGYTNAQEVEYTEQYTDPQSDYVSPLPPMLPPAPRPMTMNQNPNARVVFQEDVPTEESYLPPEILAELQANRNYDVVQNGR